MAIYARKKSGDFTPAPEGLQRAVCVDIVDLGLVETKFGIKEQVAIVWQSEEKMDTGKPFLVQKRYSPSLHPKATLRSDLESWRGRKFTDEEAEEFDLEKLLGANCQLNVVHNVTDAGTYANVKSIVPAPKGASALRVSDYTRMQDRPDWKEPKRLVRAPASEPGEMDGPPPSEEDDIPF